MPAESDNIPSGRTAVNDPHGRPGGAPPGRNPAAYDAVERYTVGQIPANERAGHPLSLFTVWFGSNLMALALVTGGLAPAAFGLSFAWSLAAIFVGNVLGGICMALHSVQGPRLGVPQMIQSRGQFGFYGSLLVILVVMLEVIGFSSSNLILGGQLLKDTFTRLPINAAIVIVAVATLAGLGFGYRIIHRLNHYASVLFGLTLLVATILIFTNAPVPSDYFSHGGFTAAGFLTMVAVCAVWQISYAPYVSDYSRYLSPDISAKRTFGFTFGGAVLGSGLTMGLGAAVALLSPAADVLTVFGKYSVGIGTAVFFVLFLGMLDTNIVNTYSGMLSSITAGHTTRPSWIPKAPGRIIVGTALVGLTLLLAILGQSSFLTEFTNFILFLVYVLIPWTAINLIDFYLIRRGRYEVNDFFRSDGGRYGKVNLTACIIYLVGIGIEIPFVDTSFYEGPVSRALGGADISWIVGLAVVSVGYYVMARRMLRRRRPRSVSQGSEAVVEA